MKKLKLYILPLLFCMLMTMPVCDTLFAADVHIIDQTVKVCYSPKYDGVSCTAQIVGEINGAKEIILVQAYSFTSQEIVDALISAHKRGVDVRIILDKSNLRGKGNKLQNVVDAGIPTYIDSKHAIAHNKVMIIDYSAIITGSFNFTKNAEVANAENSVVIHGKDLASLYTSNWKEHLSHSEAYKGH